MVTNHMNGVAANGNAEVPHIYSPAHACENPLREIGIFTNAIIALVLLDENEQCNIPGDDAGVKDSIHWLSQWIYDRTQTIDKILNAASLKEGGRNV